MIISRSYELSPDGPIATESHYGFEDAQEVDDVLTAITAAQRLASLTDDGSLVIGVVEKTIVASDDHKDLVEELLDRRDSFSNPDILEGRESQLTTKQTVRLWQLAGHVLYHAQITPRLINHPNYKEAIRHARTFSETGARAERIADKVGITMLKKSQESPDIPQTEIEAVVEGLADPHSSYMVMDISIQTRRSSPPRATVMVSKGGAVITRRWSRVA